MARVMKDSGVEWIGEIPAEWDIKKIKYILKERNEKNTPIKTRDILSLSAANGVVPYGEKTGGGNKAKDDVSLYKIAHPNDIVMNSMNVIAGSVGLSRYYGCVSPVYYMFYSEDKESDIEYFSNIFQSKEFQRSLLGLGNGILIKHSEKSDKLNTIRLRIPSEKMKNTLLPVPPSTEQQKITAFLNDKIFQIDSIIAKTKESIEAFKAYRQALVTQSVTKGLNPDVKMKDSGIEWIGEIPEHWDVSTAKRLFRKEKRPIVNDEIVTAFRDGEVTQRRNRRTGGFTMADKEIGYQGVEPGDLVIHAMDAFAGAIGVSDSQGKCSPVCSICTPITEADTYYYAYLLRTYSFLGYIESMAKGIRERSTDFRYATFAITPLIQPPITEQKQIADFLDEKNAHINSLIANKEKMIEEMEVYKKAMIYEYVTGKKEVD